MGALKDRAGPRHPGPARPADFIHIGGQLPPHVAVLLAAASWGPCSILASAVPGMSALPEVSL